MQDADLASENAPFRGPPAIDEWPIIVRFPCMPTKTISLEMDAYERLKAAKRPGESFSAVVRRGIFRKEAPTGKDLLKWYKGTASPA